MTSLRKKTFQKFETNIFVNEKKCVVGYQLGSWVIRDTKNDPSVKNFVVSDLYISGCLSDLHEKLTEIKVRF